MKYLLPCDKCGEKTPIDVNQAGQQIACVCGQMLGVPSLRGIRDLEVREDVDTAVPTAKWTVVRRVVFAIGLVVCVISLAVFGLAMVNRTNIVVPERPVYNVAASDADIDAKTPTEAWDEWVHLRTEGLGHYHEPAHVHIRGVANTLRTVMVISASVAVVGLLMAIGACVLPGAKRGS